MRWVDPFLACQRPPRRLADRFRSSAHRRLAIRSFVGFVSFVAEPSARRRATTPKQTWQRTSPMTSAVADASVLVHLAGIGQLDTSDPRAVDRAGYGTGRRCA